MGYRKKHHPRNAPWIADMPGYDLFYQYPHAYDRPTPWSRNFGWHAFRDFTFRNSIHISTSASVHTGLDSQQNSSYRSWSQEKPSSLIFGIGRIASTFGTNKASYHWQPRNFVHHFPAVRLSIFITNQGFCHKEKHQINPANSHGTSI